MCIRDRYNLVGNTLAWPESWKMETVHIIPKNNSPSNMGELRNLSCTPLFSKILESFILTKLKDEVKLSKKQYGGVKGSGTNHFLLETWDKILTSIDEPDCAANLVSIDCQKAFNSMDHTKCLEAIADLGAEDHTIDCVASFLYKRRMRVKVGESFSEPKIVPGGSPQGSILGLSLIHI